MSDPIFAIYKIAQPTKDKPLKEDSENVTPERYLAVQPGKQPIFAKSLFELKEKLEPQGIRNHKWAPAETALEHGNYFEFHV